MIQWGVHFNLCEQIHKVARERRGYTREELVMLRMREAKAKTQLGKQRKKNNPPKNWPSKTTVFFLWALPQIVQKQTTNPEEAAKLKSEVCITGQRPDMLILGSQPKEGKRQVDQPARAKPKHPKRVRARSRFKTGWEFQMVWDCCEGQPKGKLFLFYGI